MEGRKESIATGDISTGRSGFCQALGEAGPFHCSRCVSHIEQRKDHVRLRQHSLGSYEEAACAFTLHWPISL